VITKYFAWLIHYVLRTFVVRNMIIAFILEATTSTFRLFKISRDWRDETQKSPDISIGSMNGALNI